VSTIIVLMNSALLTKLVNHFRLYSVQSPIDRTSFCSK